jgi:TRAP-type C4-dicarboxylate transport system substrate-binding protein
MIMKRLLPVLLALVLLGGLIVAGCGEDETTTTASTPEATTPTTAAAGDTYYLRWAQFATAALEDSQPVIKMAENISARTNGRCKVELFWSDSLVPMFESMDAVRLGSAEMATFPFGPFGGMDVRFASSEMPLYYNTIDAQVEAQAALMPAYSGVFEEKFNQKCVMVRSIIPLAPGSAKKPIKTLADWNGILIQTISPAVTAIVENFGAVGAPASPLDVYELLQKGTVDATIQSLGKYYEAKLWEVCDYLTNCLFISASAATTINLDVWNKMPKDIQDIILDEATKAQDEIKTLTLTIYHTYLDELAANMEVYNLPAAERQVWQEKLQPVVDGMLASMGDFANDVIKTADEANAKYPYPY